MVSPDFNTVKIFEDRSGSSLTLALSAAWARILEPGPEEDRIIGSWVKKPCFMGVAPGSKGWSSSQTREDAKVTHKKTMIKGQANVLLMI
jgi:hypothetical protein